MDFSKKHCVPCEGTEDPLSEELVQQFLVSVPGWKLQEGKLHRAFKFKDFKQAMEFVNKVAELAEEESHHPDIYIFYNQVKLDLFTHAIKGLSENDYILAAKINTLTT